MQQKWLDPVIVEVSRTSSGFIDPKREARQQRRFRKDWGDVDATALGMSAAAVGAWALSQPAKVQQMIAPEVLAPLRARIEKIGVGTEPEALAVIFARAIDELEVRLALGDAGKFTVSGSGVGRHVIAGLMEYAAKPKPITICEVCARPFTARAGAVVCSASCRVEKSKAR